MDLGLVSERLIRLAESQSDALAIEDAREQVTFGNLAGRVDRLAASLVEAGLAGERVALLTAPGARWVEAFFGILRAGGTVVPLSPIHPQAEQRSFFEMSGARALLASNACRRAAEQVAAGRVLLVEELAQGMSRAPYSPKAVSETALILYTSGTTGRPKGVLLSHRNVEQLAALLKSAWELGPGDRLVHALPLHHLHGVGISLLAVLLSGGSAELLERFEARRVWEAMERGTVLMGVHTQHKKLFDAFDAADPVTRRRFERAGRALRLVTSGSAALSPTLGSRWVELAGVYPLERYGMTEAGIAISNPLRGERRPGSCGQPLPGMQIRLVTEGGRDASPGQPGEIWIRGPTVFSGYDAQPEATREAFSDGWFRSGDTALWLEGGYVKILGRTSVDILKSGGYKLSALEIEDALREHQDVSDVAVVGVPDETWGDLVVAAVVPRPGARLDEKGLRDWAKTKIAGYKVPKRVILYEELPRNALGKVQKPRLAKILERALAS